METPAGRGARWPSARRVGIRGRAAAAVPREVCWAGGRGRPGRGRRRRRHLGPSRCAVLPAARPAVAGVGCRHSGPAVRRRRRLRVGRPGGIPRVPIKCRRGRLVPEPDPLGRGGRRRTRLPADGLHLVMMIDPKGRPRRVHVFVRADGHTDPVPPTARSSTTGGPLLTRRCRGFL